MRLEDLGGKVAVVTGAGSGIGRATAMALAEQGAKVVLNDINADYLESAMSALSGSGHLGVAGDIALEETSERLAQAVTEHHGGLDLLVSNAGVMFFKDITDVTLEEFDRVMAVNVRGMFLACKYALPLMSGRSGAIVLVSSVSAYRGQEFGGTSTFTYNVSKAAVRQLATSLATRYAREGIRVNAIAPGVTRTKQIRHFLPELSPEEEDAIFEGARSVVPLNRVADPSEIANSILFLLSSQSSYVSGTTLFVDGAFTAR